MRAVEFGLDDKRQLIKKGKKWEEKEISAGIVRRQSLPYEISLFSWKNAPVQLLRAAVETF